VPDPIESRPLAFEEPTTLWESEKPFIEKDE